MKKNNRRRKRNNNTDKRNRFLIAFIYLLLVVLLIMIIYVLPSVMGFFERTYVVEHGEINVSLDAEAYIIRDERVYVADNAGTVNRIAGDEELVRGGTTIVEISGKGKSADEDKESPYADIVRNLGTAKIISDNGASQTSGYVSYNVDGAEGKLTYSALEQLTEDSLKELADIKTQDTVNGKCLAGEPVFKIVDNGSWWLVFYIESDDADRFVVGNSVEVTSGKETVRAYVDSVTGDAKADKDGKSGKTDKTAKADKDGRVRVVLKSNVYMKGYLSERRIKTTITSNSAEGLIIKNSSIVERKGQKGVLVINKLDKHIFVPINILASTDTESCISEGYYMDEGGNLVRTVGTYEEISTSPSDNDVKNAE